MKILSFLGNIKIPDFLKTGTTVVTTEGIVEPSESDNSYIIATSLLALALIVGVFLLVRKK